jgi:biotin carboxyl carrier protein
LHFETLEVRVERKGRGRPRVLAPAVGWWSDPPRDGDWVGPGSRVGRLRCLNRTFDLVLPEGLAGTVVPETDARREPVGYEQLLFRLDPAPTSRGGAASSKSSAGSAESGLPPGAHAMTAPTDGVFYSRPSPGAAPFVKLGDRLQAGQPVGLVEVMKTFHQIVYGGPGFPERAEVLELRCQDGDEVRAGQLLVIVR